MKKYAVAILNFMDNEMHIFIVEATDPVMSCKVALCMNFSEEYKTDQQKYVYSLPNDLKQLKIECFSTDIAIGVEEIK